LGLLLLVAFPDGGIPLPVGDAQHLHGCRIDTSLVLSLVGHVHTLLLEKAF
jgi:hypothetical protein